MAIQTHPKMMHEILGQVNSSPNVLWALKQSFDAPYIKKYLEMSVSDIWTTIDTTTIVCEKNDFHVSMAGTFLLNRQTFTVISEVIMNATAKESAKIVQFKALSEMLYSEEAKILSCILTKNLNSLYPNISFQIINEALSETMQSV